MRTPCLILKGQHDKPGFRDMADRLQEDSYSATLIDFNGGHADHDAIFQLLSGAAIRLFLS
jgi:hypothetical protein